VLSKNLKRARKNRCLGINELGRLTGLSPSYISALEREVKTNPSMETMEKIAEALNVTVSYLTGKSASSIIEETLEKRGMTLPELANKANVPLTFLQNLDNIVPDHEIDGGEQCYIYISSIAWVLGLPPSKLRTAFAKQEIPASEYPNITTSPEEDFGTPIEEEEIKLDDPDIRAIARAAQEMSPDERKDLARFLKNAFNKAFDDK